MFLFFKLPSTQKFKVFFGDFIKNAFWTLPYKGEVNKIPCWFLLKGENVSTSLAKQK